MATTDNKLLNGEGLSHLSTKVKEYVDEHAGGSVKEIAISTTQPTGAEVMWINPEGEGLLPEYEAGENVTFTQDSEGKTLINATDTIYDDTEIRAEIADKQDELIAGENITIEDNVISSTGGSEKFIATYGVTTAEELRAAKAANKIIQCLLYGKLYNLVRDDSDFIFQRIDINTQTTSNDALQVQELKCSYAGVWTEGYYKLTGLITAGDNITIQRGMAGAITINATGGGGSSYTFTNGLTENAGTVSWDLNDRFYKGTSGGGVAIGITYNNIMKSTGSGSIALGYGMGGNLLSSGEGSLAGGRVTSNGRTIQSTGRGSIAYGDVETAGEMMEATNYGSVALGYGAVKSKGYGSFAAGDCTQALKQYSVAFGSNTISDSPGQTSIGKCNVQDSNNTYAFIIGNGTSTSARSNALTVDWSGNIQCNNIPAPPSSDGSYKLTCTVTNGVASYTWEAN